ncbi:MAG: hypothetical protein ACOX5Q_08025 [Bacillota bacterium]|jgi:Rod binding domain-containing protein
MSSVKGMSAVEAHNALLRDIAVTEKTSGADSKLLKTCQDFESVFLTMIWKEMQKSSKVDLGVFGAFAEDAMGRSWAKSGGIGLAKVIYKSMSKHLPN